MKSPKRIKVRKQRQMSQLFALMDRGIDFINRQEADFMFSPSTPRNGKEYKLKFFCVRIGFTGHI